MNSATPTRRPLARLSALAAATTRLVACGGGNDEDDTPEATALKLGDQ